MIQDDVARAINKILGTKEVAFNIPPKREFGDFSTAVCLAQAKEQKRAPMQIAHDVKARLDQVKLPFIREILVTPPGYLNFKIDHPKYVRSIMGRVVKEAGRYGCSNVGRGRKILVEHTNVNPNKAMHIGHLRNAIIGDSVVRILRKLNYNVEACNYVDDTGVQVADVVVAMLYMDEPRYEGGDSEITARKASAGAGFPNPAPQRLDAIWAKWDKSHPFDYWCWDVYSRVTQAYEKDEALKAKRAEVLHALESQDGAIARFAKEVATKIVEAHLATVGRLNVFYDLLNWESDIFLRGFWKRAFELLKASGAIVHETKGPNAGCWVVKFGRGVFQTKSGLKSEDKILVRSNGTVTYTGKDIAYQMWKFGVLGHDFLYKLWGVQANGDELWTTAPDGVESGRFGNAEKVINVIDVRQSYPQQIVYDCLRKLGYKKEAGNSIHLDYEVVVLSNTAAAEIGVDVDADEPGTQAMSGRKGLGVKGDDLINTMVKRLSEKMNKDDSAHVLAAAKQSPNQERNLVLAAAAIRYFMSRISTGKMIVFDFDEALRTTGDTGVYCQYAHARACGILKKAGIKTIGKIELPNRITLPEENLIKKIDEFGSVLKKAGKELSPAPLAHFAFELATVFTEFYETPDPEAAQQVPFIKIEERVLRNYRLALVDTFRQVMANCLGALGIVPLERI